ncbi:hypothetical protein GCM10010172_66720 [Paractinoplanes ferrugineus]|uniref:Uncharacterized protein n=1 Tax=Paractinoplanes ferrugineus TaxID=113564 RepID=A0A919J4D2_9ACTN|nr:hypothetical protein [Actinoplanes ferrugineus]GIE13167.1 hypothetical protein Afe05nite_50070 [Actinoplanes ferrugineus]
MSTEDVRPFISAAERVDVLGRLARENSDRIAVVVDDLIANGLDLGSTKKDGKDGAKDAGEAGFWDKKDGAKDGGSNDKIKDKDGGKDGGDKGGKESSDKGGKETSDKGKDTSDKGHSKDGSKDGSKEGIDGDKLLAAENELIIHDLDFVTIPVDITEQIQDLHEARLTALLSQPII